MKKILEKIIKKQLKKQPFPLISVGESMIPLLYPQDKVYLQSVVFSAIKVNDIVAFKKNGQLICHRVIYKGKNYLIAKGDNGFQIDGKIKPKNILGKIEEVKRGGKIFNLNFLYLIQSTHYFEEIVKIKKKLEEAKVNFVFLKGLPLHLYYQGSHPRRFYADCDVLVEKKDFEKAQKILFSFGYQKVDTGLSSTHKKLNTEKVENVYSKKIKDWWVSFDLHLEVVFMMTQFGGLEALYQQTFIDRLTEKFLNNKKQIIINREKFFILNSKFLIFYLALHFFHHNFQGAFRLEFLAAVIKKEGRKKKIWQEIGAAINDCNLNNFVYPAFVLAKKYYQLHIPKRFLREIAPKNNLTFKLLRLADKIGVFTYYPLIKPRKINIFKEAPRIKAGVWRFLNLFFLSPSPFFKKILVVFNRGVWYSLFFLVKNKIKSILAGTI